MKKRHIIYIALLIMLFVSLAGVFGIPQLAPVQPLIVLPGEPVIPGIPILGSITNTFIATVVTYLIILAIVIAVNARSRTPDEVPTGFYNLVEMIIEGAYNFVESAAGRWAPRFFPFFFTFILLILLANWLELVPGVDSIGKWENLPHFRAELALHAAEDQLEAGATPLEALNTAPLSAEARAVLVEEFDLTPETELTAEEELLFLEELEHAVDEAVDEANTGDLRRDPFLLRAPEPAPEDADWAIVPYLRAPATDLNFTLGLALVSVLFTQYFGLRALGADYLGKFFTWNSDKVARNPLGLMDTGVGILEFISELSKILSFAFRLFGNIFAGQVLLFVIGALAPVAMIGVYGLEFFVGFIQAAVFAMLTLTFMAGATVSHHHEEEH